MKQQAYCGLNGRGEKLEYTGYIIADGLFGVRFEKNDPVYQRWKIDHIPTGSYTAYANSRKKAFEIIDQVLQVAKDNKINLWFKSKDEIPCEHYKLLKEAFGR